MIRRWQEPAVDRRPFEHRLASPQKGSGAGPQVGPGGRGQTIHPILGQTKPKRLSRYSIAAMGTRFRICQPALQNTLSRHSQPAPTPEHVRMSLRGYRDCRG